MVYCRHLVSRGAVRKLVPNGHSLSLRAFMEHTDKQLFIRRAPCISDVHLINACTPYVTSVRTSTHAIALMLCG